MKQILFSIVLVVGLFANAGGVKDLLIDHEEAVSMKMWGTFQPPFEGAISNTRYVKADPGFFLAMASDVQVYGQSRTITCVSQFVKTGTQRFVIKSVTCE